YTPAVTGSNPVPPTSLRLGRPGPTNARRGEVTVAANRQWQSAIANGNRQSVIGSAQSAICSRQSAVSRGVVVQLVRTPACHAGGREFEPRRPRHLLIRTQQLPGRRSG